MPRRRPIIDNIDAAIADAEDRLKGLQRIKQLREELDQALEHLTSYNTSPRTTRRGKRVNGHRKPMASAESGKRLIDYLRQAMQDGKERTSIEATAEVIKLGYGSKSKHVKEVVYQYLAKRPEFQQTTRLDKYNKFLMVQSPPKKGVD